MQGMKCMCEHILALSHRRRINEFYRTNHPFEIWGKGRRITTAHSPPACRTGYTPNEVCDKSGSIHIARKKADITAHVIWCACTNGEYMIIKSDKGNLVFIVFSYLVCFLLGTIFIFENDGQTSAVYLGLLVWIVGAVICIRWYIAVFRTILIGPSGVTILFHRRTKFYTWSSILIYYESNEDQLGLRTQYKGAVILSPCKRKKAKHISPLIYCTIFHPYSFLFINFYEESRMKDAPNVYAVKKQEFLSKMTDLGIIGPDFFCQSNKKL